MKKSIFPLPAHIPLTAVLIIPFVLLNLLITSLVGIISFRNGQQAVNLVSLELREEIAQRINDHLLEALQIPHQIINENKIQITLGYLSPFELDSVQRYFLETVKTFPSISSTYFGSVDGGIVGSGRESNQEVYYSYETEGLQPGKFTKYAVAENGMKQTILSQVEYYDARTRPWYKASLENHAPSWSDIYILATGQDMAIAASLPIYDDANNLIGVTAVDLFLSQISKFLKEIKFSQNGASFIIEKNGLLVASSTNELPFQRDTDNSEKLARISAEKSENETIRNAALHLLSQYGEYQNIPQNNVDTQFLINGKNYFIRIQPLLDPYGINWFIVVVLPEDDFMAQINANNRTTGFIVVTALLITLILSAATGTVIARRISKVGQAAEALAEGKWDEAYAVSSKVDEIDRLANSYNRMAGEIRRLLLDLNEEIEERKLIATNLSESKEQFRSLVENIPLGVFRADKEGTLIAINPALKRLLKITENQLDDLKIRDFFSEKSDFDSMINQIHSQNNYVNKEFMLSRSTGEHFWANIFIHAIRHSRNAGYPAEKNITYIDGVIEDITERRLAEQKIKQSLTEKNTLLQELYHRTKNNMQVINSLLMIQSQEINDERINWVFTNMVNRIHAMAMVHEKLYESHDLSKINLKEYVHDLAQQLLIGYHHPDKQIDLVVEMKDFFVPLDLAIPCGLILNELITNSLKYAFVDSNTGTIKIQIGYISKEMIEMIIEDNGSGFQTYQDANFNKKMGLRTVESIVQHQLRGQISLESQNGTRWVIQFSDRYYLPRI